MKNNAINLTLSNNIKYLSQIKFTRKIFFYFLVRKNSFILFSAFIIGISFSYILHFLLLEIILKNHTREYLLFNEMINLRITNIISSRNWFYFKTFVLSIASKFYHLWPSIYYENIHRTNGVWMRFLLSFPERIVNDALLIKASFGVRIQNVDKCMYHNH